MILNIICFKNCVIDAFTQPQYIDIEPEKAAIQLARSITLEQNLDKVLVYKDLELYKIGTFDDSTGIIEQDAPELIVDLRKLVAKKLVAFNGKEGVQDGGNN